MSFRPEISGTASPRRDDIRPYPLRYRSKDRLGTPVTDGELNRSGVPMPKYFLEPNSLSSKKDREQKNLRYMPPNQRPHPTRSAPSLSGSQTRILHSRHNDSADLDSSFQFMRSAGRNGGTTETFFRKYFEIQERLGFGSFGDVFRTKSSIDGKEYAVKKSRKTYSGEGDRSRQLREVQRVVNIPSHTHMVELERAWEEEGHLYIQMELCRKSLNQELEEGHQFSEMETWNVLIDMLLALEHLHKHHLVHMDLKPDNIFLTIDQPPIYKLGDFGIVISLDQKRDVNEYTDGDSRYLAPEVMQGQLSTKVDIFSLGLTILEIACHVDLPKSGQLWHHLRSGGSLPDPCNKLLPESLTEVLHLMLSPDPANRPEAADLFKLPIVKRELRRRNWFLGISYLKRKLNSLKRMWNIVVLFIASLLVFRKRNEPSPLSELRATPEPYQPPEQPVPGIMLNDTSFSDDDELQLHGSPNLTPVFASTPISAVKSSARHRTGRFSRADTEDKKVMGSPTSRNLLKEFEAVSD